LLFPRDSPEYKRQKKQELAFRLANERLSQEDVVKIKALKSALDTAPAILLFMEDDQCAVWQIKSICELWISSAERPKKQGVSSDMKKSRSLLRNELFVLLCITFSKYVQGATLGRGLKSPFMRYVQACYKSQGEAVPIKTIAYRIKPAIDRYKGAVQMRDHEPLERLFAAFFGVS
jgi:hypothetical protein